MIRTISAAVSLLVVVLAGCSSSPTVEPAPTTSCRHGQMAKVAELYAGEEADAFVYQPEAGKPTLPEVTDPGVGSGITRAQFPMELLLARLDERVAVARIGVWLGHQGDQIADRVPPC